MKALRAAARTAGADAVAQPQDRGAGRSISATTPDPDRGYALAILTGALTFKNVKPAVLRDVVTREVDPHLFALSYDYVGDLGRDHRADLAASRRQRGAAVADRR